MKNTVILNYTELQNKLKQLDEEKNAIEYLLKNYFAGSPNQSPTLFDTDAEQPAIKQVVSTVSPGSDLDPTKPTKPLIIDILKKEGRPMKWKEVFDIFSKLKPEIAVGTVRVSLSEMGRKDKFPVGYKDERYWYEEKKAV